MNVRGYQATYDHVYALEVFYGVNHSILRLTLSDNVWKVQEDVLESIVASRCQEVSHAPAA